MKYYTIEYEDGVYQVTSSDPKSITTRELFRSENRQEALDFIDDQFRKSQLTPFQFIRDRMSEEHFIFSEVFRTQADLVGKLSLKEAEETTRKEWVGMVGGEWGEFAATYNQYRAHRERTAFNGILSMIQRGEGHEHPKDDEEVCSECSIARCLTLIWASHPEFNPEWRFWTE